MSFRKRKDGRFEMDIDAWHPSGDDQDCSECTVVFNSIEDMEELAQDLLDYCKQLRDDPEWHGGLC